MVIDGTTYTRDQLRSCIAAAWELSLAYAKADPDNGGGEEVEWEDLDNAADLANEAWTDEDRARLTRTAKVENGA